MPITRMRVRRKGGALSGGASLGERGAFEGDVIRWLVEVDHASNAERRAT